MSAPSRHACRGCPRIWGTAIRARPTGICRRHPSCWHWPPIASNGSDGRSVMSLVAPTLQGFFTDRLSTQRQASQHTIASYRDTCRLLLQFMHGRTGKPPSRLDWGDLDAAAVTAFLEHVETDRGNGPRTRNARLTAIRSLFVYASLQHPEHATSIAHVLAIPPKRFDKAIVSYLDDAEAAALLAAPNRATWVGRRDHTLIALATQTGLRISELLGLDRGDIV